LQLKPLLLLVALTTILPELLSGNTPVPKLLTAESVVIFGLAYALPVVFLREWAVRAGTGAFGLFVMGIGYGLINEALYARTIFRLTNVPVDTFDAYSFAFGVNWGWAAFICVWHGVASVVLPIMLTHRVFPSNAPWLPRWAFALWGVVMALAASGFFLMIGTLPAEAVIGSVANEAVTLPLLWLAILAFWIVGGRMAPGPVKHSDRRVLPFVIGLTGMFAFVLCAIPSDQGWPVAVNFLVLGAVILAYLLVLRWFGLSASQPFAWFALGWYVNVALLSWTAMIYTSPVTVVVDTFVLACMFVALFIVSKRKTAEREITR
jgi:hypothetical protein